MKTVLILVALATALTGVAFLYGYLNKKVTKKNLNTKGKIAFGVLATVIIYVGYLIING